MTHQELKPNTSPGHRMSCFDLSTGLKGQMSADLRGHALTLGFCGIIEAKVGPILLLASGLGERTRLRGFRPGPTQTSLHI